MIDMERVLLEAESGEGGGENNLYIFVVFNTAILGKGKS